MTAEPLPSDRVNLYPRPRAPHAEHRMAKKRGGHPAPTPGKPVRGEVRASIGQAPRRSWRKRPNQDKALNSPIATPLRGRTERRVRTGLSVLVLAVYPDSPFWIRSAGNPCDRVWREPRTDTSRGWVRGTSPWHTGWAAHPGHRRVQRSRVPKWFALMGAYPALPLISLGR